MKILIVDDEKLIRVGLIKILTEHFGDVVEILQAKNGEEAWVQICESTPDILITDIRMPKLDGIELLRLVSTLEQKPAIVILSGYEEFSYAQEAIRHGVANYILKPVDKKELFSVLDTLVENIQQKKREQTEQLLISAFKGGVLQKNILQKLIAQREYRIVQCIKASAKNISGLLSKYHSFLIEEKPHTLTLLVPESERHTLLDDLLQNSLFLGISDIIENSANLQSCRTHAHIASFVRFFTKEKRIVLYESLYEAPGYSGGNRSIDALAVLIGTGNKTAIQKILNDLFTFQEDSLFHNVIALYKITSQIPSLFTTFHHYIEMDPYLSMKTFLLQDIDRYIAISDIQKDLSDFVLYLDIIQKQKYSDYPFIEHALAFITKHYKETISMATVANHCSVNYTYFSEKFKQVVGIHFNDYIKQLRIQEAKRLLQQGCYKVYEVASRSGFGDVKYFMKTFKEATGLSPGEYQKRFIS